MVIDNGRLFGGIASSAVFLALGTGNYLAELRDTKSDVAQQVAMARALGKKVLLLIDRYLSATEADELRAFFSAFKHVKEIPFDSSDVRAAGETIRQGIAALMGGQPQEGGR